MKPIRHSYLCLSKNLTVLSIVLFLVKFCQGGYESGWDYYNYQFAEECNREHTWEPYSQECLTSLWLEAGCLLSGARSPPNAENQQIQWWNTKSSAEVFEDMRLYFSYATNGNSEYREKCFGNTDGCTFQEFKEHALYGHNDNVLSNSNVQACAEQCNAMAGACKSFDFNTETHLCILSSLNRETAPEAFGAHETLDYYEKVCGGGLTNPWEETEIDNSGIVNGFIKYEGGYCYIHYGPIGGSGGEPFNDKDFAMHQNITKITVRYADLIDAIQVTYGARSAERHGGTGGSLFEISFDKDEFITGVNLRIETFGESIAFITNKRVLGPFGNSRASKEYSVVTEGKALAYIAGRSGGLIDQLTFVFNC